MGGYAEWPPRNPLPRQEAPRRSYRLPSELADDEELASLRSENARLLAENRRLQAEVTRLRGSRRAEPATDEVPPDDGVSDTEKRFKLIELW